MPHKHNADRRRHIPKMSFKVRNWPAYEAGLRRWGSLTLWIEDATLGDWQSTAHGDEIEVVIPPRSTAVLSGEPGPPTQRDRHLAMIAEHGRLAWQATTGYGQRSLVETTMGRYKALIGPRLRARGFAAQQTEAAVGVAVLNRMLAARRPDSVRRQPVIA